MPTSERLKSTKVLPFLWTSVQRIPGRIKLVAAALAVGTGALLVAPPASTSESRMPQAGPSAKTPWTVAAVTTGQATRLAALRLNAAIPTKPTGHVANRLTLVPRSEQDHQRALDCLTSAVYYEAATETLEGQQAVAQVVLNRVRHPAFGSNICDVVFEGGERPTGCQFSFTCDGSLLRSPVRSAWVRARSVAEAALTGFVYAPVGLSTHYHANYVSPRWARQLDKQAVVGAHIFYAWPGSWGTLKAFSQRYNGMEQPYADLSERVLRALARRSGAPAVLANERVDDGVAASKASEPIDSPTLRLAALEARITMASAKLGRRHPKMIAAERQRASLATEVKSSGADQIEALERLLTSARRSLGPRHPEIIALERRRAELGKG